MLNTRTNYSFYRGGSSLRVTRSFFSIIPRTRLDRERVLLTTTGVNNKICGGMAATIYTYVDQHHTYGSWNCYGDSLIVNA